MTPDEPDYPPIDLRERRAARALWQTLERLAARGVLVEPGEFTDDYSVVTYRRTDGATAPVPCLLCHRCGASSVHPQDVAERYCPYCHRFHPRPAGDHPPRTKKRPPSAEDARGQ